MEDCFFYLDTEEIMRCLCVEHGKEQEKAWFWEGSNLGYGPYLFKCNICGKVIYTPDEAETDIQDE